MTSIITSQLMIQTVDMKEIIADHNENKAPADQSKVVTVKDTWEDFLARLLVHGERKSTYIDRFDTYDEMLDAIVKNDSYYSAMIDYNVAAVRMEEIKRRQLGNHLKYHISTLVKTNLLHQKS